MRAFACTTALCLVILVLWEIFETIVLPRKIDRRFRLTRYFYACSWEVFGFLGTRLIQPKGRQAFLSIFGPLSMLGLFVVWGVTLILSFALMNWALYSPYKLPDGDRPGFAMDLYMSGTTMTTLGLGDVTPLSAPGRLITVIEAGLGLGLVALVISYLPALYQAFSRRETEISLLDARAGSPPSVTEMLLRAAERNRLRDLDKVLADWERWCAEIMESHISYPVLCYFRSQHTNQSWVTAVTAILDTCAICTSCIHPQDFPQAKLTFAMARHAVVDITQVFNQRPTMEMPERLSRDGFNKMCEDLRKNGVNIVADDNSWNQLKEKRMLYEPYLFVLSGHLRMDLAPWSHPAGIRDNWVASKWKGHDFTETKPRR